MSTHPKYGFNPKPRKVLEPNFHQATDSRRRGAPLIIMWKPSPSRAIGYTRIDGQANESAGFIPDVSCQLLYGSCSPGGCIGEARIKQESQFEFRYCPKWQWLRRTEAQLRSHCALMSLAGDNLSGPAMR